MGLSAVSGVRVLKVSIPAHIDVDEHEVRLLMAVELYREGRLTLEQAAELAGLCVEDFMRELSRRKVSIINWGEEELEEELRIAERFVKGAKS